MEAAGVAQPLGKDAQPFLSSLLGREKLQEAAVPLLPRVPLTSCTAVTCLLGDSMILFNAGGADGCTGHPGPTCRKGNREETTFGAVPNTACSWQTVQARAPSPWSLQLQDKMGVTLQPPAHDVLLEGSPPAPHSPSSVGTQPLLPARKVTCRTRQSQS